MKNISKLLVGGLVGLACCSFSLHAGKRQQFLNQELETPAAKAQRDTVATATFVIDLAHKLAEERRRVAAQKDREEAYAAFLEKQKRQEALFLAEQKQVALLEKNGFEVLSLPPQTSPSGVADKMLEFLSVRHDSGSHTFTVLKGDVSRNIQLAIPGTVFTSADGAVILATLLNLPDGIAGFLAQKGYQTLFLSPFVSSQS